MIQIIIILKYLLDGIKIHKIIISYTQLSFFFIGGDLALTMLIYKPADLKYAIGVINLFGFLHSNKASPFK